MKTKQGYWRRLAAFITGGALPLALVLAGSAYAAQVPMPAEVRSNAITTTCEQRGGGLSWPIQGSPQCHDAHESLDDYMRRTGFNPVVEPSPSSQRALDTCAQRGGGIVNHIGIPGRTECQGAREYVTQYDARLSGMTQGPPPSAPSGERQHAVEAGAPQAGGQPLGGPGVSQGAADTPPPPNPGEGMGAAMMVVGAGAAVAGAVALGSALSDTAYDDGTGGGGSCYLRSCIRSSSQGSCSCQEFDSSELCQFSETSPGGQCSDGAGYTTALCPANYSCVNGTCRNDC